jgi:hypothetical protein
VGSIGGIAVPVAVILLALIVVAPLVKDWTPRKVGFRLLLLGCAMSSWNAVIFHSVRPTDAILVLALVILGADGIMSQKLSGLPRQLVMGSVLIAVAGLFSEFQPPSAEYLSTRLNFVSARVTFGNFEAKQHNLTELAKFEVALVAVPLVFVLLRPALRELRQLASAFLVSVLISCVVAMTDQANLTHISTKLVGYESHSGREAGLTLHSNYLAASCALAVPVAALWLTDRTTRRRAAGVTAIAIILVGTLLTGSRGGAVGVALALAVSLFVLRGARWVLVVGAVIVPIVLIATYNQLSNVTQFVLTRTRISGATSAQVASASRAVLRNQGFADFGYHPLQGIGYQVISQAQEVHIGLLAAGGLLGFVGWVIYIWGAVLRIRPARKADLQLAQAMAITIFTWLILNFVENQVTDRFLYIPSGIVLALARIGASSPSETPEVAAPPPVLARGLGAAPSAKAGTGTVARVNRPA